MSDESGETRYEYERRGFLRRETKSVLGDTFILQFRYDENGNRRGLTYPSGRELTYDFDYADRPLKLNGTFAGVTTQYIYSAKYEPFGPVTSLFYGGGSIERRLRTMAGTVSRHSNVVANGTPLAAYHYGYDAAGNVTAISDILDQRYSRDFGYDDLNRLTSATTGSALWGSASWMYDGTGNRATDAGLPHAVGGLCRHHVASRSSHRRGSNANRGVRCGRKRARRGGQRLHIRAPRNARNRGWSALPL